MAGKNDENLCLGSCGRLSEFFRQGHGAVAAGYAGFEILFHYRVFPYIAGKDFPVFHLQHQRFTLMLKQDMIIHFFLIRMALYGQLVIMTAGSLV